MAEYDKGRYYWIKLTDRFMTSDTVDFLMSQKDGANYVVLYQMLCLKTVNNGGLLARELGEMIVPYDVNKIQRDCKWFNTDTVRIALELYKKLGLIYESTDGIFAISDFDRLVGSQSIGAEKKELQKQRREDNLLQGGTLGGTKVENFPPDKDIKRIDIKRIDIRDNIDYLHIRDMYNDICISFPRLTVLSDKRKQAIRARFNTYTEEQFRELFEKAEASSFLKGANDRNWQANFDWLIKDANFAKVLDGNYDDNLNKTATQHKLNDTDRFMEELRSMYQT
jgi:hypothetical protein